MRLITDNYAINRDLKKTLIVAQHLYLYIITIYIVFIELMHYIPSLLKPYDNFVWEITQNVSIIHIPPL